MITFNVLISGPEESPYENGCFKLELFLPSEYPMAPPKVRFLTRPYHPHIDRLAKDGIRLTSYYSMHMCVDYPPLFPFCLSLPAPCFPAVSRSLPVSPSLHFKFYVVLCLWGFTPQARASHHWYLHIRHVWPCLLLPPG